MNEIIFQMCFFYSDKHRNEQEKSNRTFKKKQSYVQEFSTARKLQIKFWFTNLN